MSFPDSAGENSNPTLVGTLRGGSLAQGTLPTPAAMMRRVSRLAVLALLAAAIAPSLQVLRDSAGGSWEWLGRLAARGPVFLMGLDLGAVLLFAFAVIAGLVALAQVSQRSDLRGGALAVGALALAVGGLAAGGYARMAGGKLAGIVASMGGGSDTYVWRTTVVVLAAAVACEIVLTIAGGPGRAAEALPEPLAAAGH